MFLLPQSTPPPEVVAPEAEAEAVATPESRGLTLLNCGLSTGDIINLRAGPGLDYEIRAEIPFQTSLRASNRMGDWFEVEYEGEIGWVHIDYVFRSGYCG